jgi:hypothetical protein
MWITVKKRVEIRRSHVNNVFVDKLVGNVYNFFKSFYTKVLFVGKFVDNVDMSENL